LKKKSIFILGVNRSGTTSLAINLGKQIGRYIIEPWGKRKHINNYPISNVADKYNTVLKSIINQKPEQRKEDFFHFLVELVEYFGIDNTIFITRKNFDEHILSYSNLMYAKYKFDEHFKKTGIKDFSFFKNMSKSWKISDLPKSYLHNQELQDKYRSILSKQNHLLSKLSSHFGKKIIWYEDLYGKDRKLSLDIIKSWKFDINCNLLNEQLDPKFKYMKKEEFRLL